jgi:hypothetical protein
LIEDPCFPIKLITYDETTKSRIAQTTGTWAALAIFFVTGYGIPLIRLNILNTASIAAEISALGSSFPDTITTLSPVPMGPSRIQTRAIILQMRFLEEKQREREREGQGSLRRREERTMAIDSRSLKEALLGLRS